MKAYFRLLVGAPFLGMLTLWNIAYSQNHPNETARITEEGNAPQEAVEEEAPTSKREPYIFLKNNWVLTDLPRNRIGEGLKDREIISVHPFPRYKLTLFQLNSSASRKPKILLFKRHQSLEELKEQGVDFYYSGNFILIRGPHGNRYLYGLKPHRQFDAGVIRWIEQTTNTP